ncbi:MAG: hypothetical protein H6728_11780 [Myxococcales bacterium]|nr:hypothetical protein [Myxococcales bacterium]
MRVVLDLDVAGGAWPKFSYRCCLEESSYGVVVRKTFLGDLFFLHHGRKRWRPKRKRKVFVCLRIHPCNLLQGESGFKEELDWLLMGSLWLGRLFLVVGMSPWEKSEQLLFYRLLLGGKAVGMRWLQTLCKKDHHHVFFFSLFAVVLVFYVFDGCLGKTASAQTEVAQRRFQEKIKEMLPLFGYLDEAASRYFEI